MGEDGGLCGRNETLVSFLGGERRELTPCSPFATNGSGKLAESVHVLRERSCMRTGIVFLLVALEPFMALPAASADIAEDVGRGQALQSEGRLLEAESNFVAQ